MAGDISPYTALVINEHADKPRFMASLAALLQPVADGIAVLESMPGLYDLDAAVGVQLDAVGLWVGRSRNLQVAIVGVFFSFDTAGLGFGAGVWQGPFNPGTDVVVLDDETYRLFLRAVIGANNWDGTAVGAYNVLLPLLAAYGAGMTIADNDNMTMTVALTGATLPPIIAAMFTGRYIEFRPAGVLQIGP